MVGFTSHIGYITIATKAKHTKIFRELSPLEFEELENVGITI